jgi:four helix bundle protein
MVYKVILDFSDDERFGLTSRMRRVVISITSNITEGLGRKPYKEKIKFYYLARSSLTELQNQLIAAKDVGYLNQEPFKICFKKSVNVHKILTGLIERSQGFLPAS